MIIAFSLAVGSHFAQTSEDSAAANVASVPAELKCVGSSSAIHEVQNSKAAAEPNAVSWSLRFRDSYTIGRYACFGIAGD